MEANVPSKNKIRLRLVIAGLCLLISAVGDEVAGISLALRSQQSSWPGWTTGAIMAGSLAPMLVLAKPVARIVDSFELRRLLVVVMLLEGVVAVSLSGVNSPIEAIAIALALGSLGALASAATFVLLPHVVPEKNLATATGLLQGVTGAAALVGPALGGILVSAGGTSRALQIDGVSFLVASLGFAVLHGERRPVPQEASDTRSGFHVLFSNQVLRKVLPFFYLGVFASVLINAARLYFTIDVLHQSPATYGLTGAAAPAGLVLGGLFAGQAYQRFGVKLATAAGFVLIGGAVVITGLTRSIVLMTLSCVIVGVGNVVANVAVKMTMFDQLEESVRARGAAAYLALLAASFTPGVILGGVFGKTHSPATLVVAGVAAVAAGVGTWFLAPSKQQANS